VSTAAKRHEEAIPQFETQINFAFAERVIVPYKPLPETMRPVGMDSAKPFWKNPDFNTAIVQSGKQKPT